MKTAPAKTPKVAPLSKLFFTAAVSVWSLLLSTIPALAGLVAVQLALLALAGQLVRTIRAIGMLTIFAAVLAALQYACGSTPETSVATGLRMISMTLVFLLLLATTSMRHLTAALVSQCRVPNEYAFMFTAALRFVPDFLAESKAVREAQTCRGYAPKGNILAHFASYAALVEPLVMRAVSRSETMALSLALRGFGGKKRSFGTNVALRSHDYALLTGMAVITAALAVM
ncbi:MAG: energy-coupling factor transporter transmembrane protein EcfT [Negativicutes bacterium]|nr:energy-coupling factor transporter transmembrane protein EcfT [Negativicutes bacterium]